MSAVTDLMGTMKTWATGLTKSNAEISTGKFIESIENGGFIDGTSANRTTI
jgi:hypothetical protein